MDAPRRRRTAALLTLCLAASTLLASGTARAEVTGCADFASQAKAQSFYLTNGGPAQDAYGLDPDANGIACDANPAPYRGILTIGYAGQSFTGALVPGAAACASGRKVTVFELRNKKPPKTIGSDVLDDDGTYAIGSTRSSGRYVAKIPKTAPCSSEASAVFSVGNRRLEISPAEGLLFTDTGQVQNVSAEYVDDATGARTPATDAWFRSTDQSAFTVTRSGEVTSIEKDGSAQIIAMGQGLSSAPILAVAATLHPDAVTLHDQQIDSGPTANDDGTFTARLLLDDPPSIGRVYVGIETTGLVGRVEDFVEFKSGIYDVTFSHPPLTDVVPQLTIDESYDMGNAPVTLSDAASDFDVSRAGTTLTFTEKTPPAAASGAYLPLADEEPSGPCKVTAGPGSPVKFTPFKASVNINPKVDFVDVDGQFRRMVVSADPVITIEHGVSIQAAFEATIKCEFDLYEYRKPIPGFLGALIGFQVPIGFVFSVGGKVTLAGVSVKKVTTLESHLALGVDCPDGGNCSLVEQLNAKDPVSKVTWTRQNPLDGPRFEPELSAKVNIAAQFGAHEPKDIRFTFVEAEYGAKLAGQFGTVADQLANDGFQSEYKINLEGSVTPGPQLAKLAEKLNVGSIDAPSLELPGVEVARSPTGMMEIDGSYRKAELKVKLGNTDFFDCCGPYNVDSVILMRRDSNSGEIEQIDQKQASEGQRVFNFTYIAENWQQSDFYAMVVTKILPYDDFQLEVAKGYFFSCKSASGGEYEPQC